MNIFKKIFLLVLLLFPIGEIVRINLGIGLIIKPLDVGVAVIVLSWLAIKISRKQKIKKTHILIPTILFALSGFISLIISDLGLSLKEFLVSLSYLLRWLVYAGIFFVVSDFSQNFRKKISNILVITGALVVGLGYLQYFYYPNLKNLFYLGWDEHMHRMFSVFLDPNFAGAFFVLYFLFLVNLYLKKNSKIIGFLLASTLMAVFLTFSRSALIMLVASSTLLFVKMDKKIGIAVVFGVSLLAILISSKYFFIENINLLRVVSSEARIETARKAIEIIHDHPLFGVGFNAYRYAKLGIHQRNMPDRLVSHADAGVDNSFLFVIATTGIVGFILYLFLWFRLLKISSILAFVSIIGVFIDSLFINSLFYPFIMLWLWIILAL